MGHTSGPDTAVPWRLVRGDGRPRTAMDVAADANGAVWSDLEAGEIWAVTPTGQVHRLATGVHPWAITLTATEVLFTDTEARKILAVPR
jgi:DNA topoisomerase VI subunit A